MNFRTNIPLSKQSHNLIDYDSNVLLLGSCFSENVGAFFEYYKFQNCVNPFGILFHPLALERLITNVINEKQFTQDDVFRLNELWHCFEAHSRMSNPSQDTLLHNLNNASNQLKGQLHQSSHIILTLGTAWVYRHISTDKVVANCHKVPQKKFLKELMSIDTIVESLDGLMSLIRDINPKVNFILTVSPVRHLKNGFIENQQSKAHLIAAIHQLVTPQKHTFYFPSYEIMMDELRDYRFYEEDMIHPNKVAIAYIWEKFKNTWLSGETNSIMNDVKEIQKGLAHKPLNPHSQSHKKFLSNLQEKQKKLSDKLPKLEF